LTCMRAFGRAGPVNHSRTDGSSSRFLASPRTLQLPFTALASQPKQRRSSPSFTWMRLVCCAPDSGSKPLRRRTDGNVLLGWIGYLQSCSRSSAHWPTFPVVLFIYPVVK